MIIKLVFSSLIAAASSPEGATEACGSEDSFAPLASLLASPSFAGEGTEGGSTVKSVVSWLPIGEGSGESAAVFAASSSLEEGGIEVPAASSIGGDTCGVAVGTLNLTTRFVSVARFALLAAGPERFDLLVPVPVAMACMASTLDVAVRFLTDLRNTISVVESRGGVVCEVAMVDVIVWTLERENQVKFVVVDSASK